MKLYTLDFETYYDKEYSLSKMTTEAYIRDARFEPILLGFKVDDGTEGWAHGQDNIQLLLDSLDIENNAVLAHHAHFDGLILSHHFNHRPKVWFDTLSMARAHHGIDVGGSLKKLLKFYEGEAPVQKGTEVENHIGRRLDRFTWPQLCSYAQYCCDDVEGTHFLMQKMLPHFSKNELRFIDRIIRMFTEPAMHLDRDWLLEYARDIEANKLTMLFEAGVTREEVMSNDKFAQALERLGVTPPKKLSLTTGKETWAFAKTDRAMEKLQDHPDDRVQTLVAARLGNKTTINETRALRMADMATRGPACLYYKYAGALQTMRVSGGDKMNWQNMQRVRWDDQTGTLLRGQLRMSLYAPPGHVLVVVDSANIEARVLDWLAGQDDMLEIYRRADRGEGPDVYCVLATELFGREVTKKDKIDRNVGKYVKLGCGFGMGPPKFIDTVRIQSEGTLRLDLPTSSKYVEFYRTRHPMVTNLWNRAKSALPVIAQGPSEDHEMFLDPRGLLRIARHKVFLPNGLPIKYPGLVFKRAAAGDEEQRSEWQYISRRMARRDGGEALEWSRIYGGKVVENIVQALARIIVVDQAGEVTKKYKGVAQEVMTTHDEGTWVVPEDRAEEVLDFAVDAFKVPPAWAPDLPLSAEGSHAVRYGEAK
jgi:DNA polymerase I-like protein with 3'-5' exonuclease and polymerase domains